MHPIFAKVFRLSKNSPVAHGRRKTNRDDVKFPALHRLLKFCEKLSRSHSWTGCKFAFNSLGHKQFHEGATDIDDENSSLHEPASARRENGLTGRARTIGSCRSSVRTLR